MTDQRSVNGRRIRASRGGSSEGSMARLAAAVVALVAWAGLAVQFQATLESSGSLAGTVWILVRFFTILTNLLVAITFSALALGRSVPSFWLGGITLAIVFVGVVYMLLLRGLLALSGGAALADTLLHKVVPVLVPLYWLAFAPKGRLKWRDPLLWAVYPSVYLIYALARGRMGDRYAYPFIDVGELGAAQVAINVAAIAAFFVVAGLAFVRIDWRLARYQSRPRP